MSTARYAFRPVSVGTELPFQTAEEAWLWYALSQIARNEGARPQADKSGISRPCTPDDIYRIVSAQYKSGRLTVHHVKILFRYGMALMVPNAKVRGEERAAGLWSEALDRIGLVFQEKGIVA